MRSRQASHGFDHVAYIGELRKCARGQERANLEMPHAGSIFVANPALLCKRGGKGFHHLQAVPQANLAQAHSVAGINLLNAGHASLTAGEENFLSSGSFLASSSARTASVSAPSAGTLRPSPRLAPFHCSGSAGTRNASPLALILLTRPPGRSTC